MFDVPARSLLTPSPQISDDTLQSSNGSTYIQKHRFDDRSQTSISIALRSNASKLSRQLGRNNSSFDGTKNSTFQWNELHKILKAIEGSSFAANYGTVVTIEPSSLYVAVGTLKGYVICFNYHQEAEYSLHPMSETEGPNALQSHQTLAQASTSGSIRDSHPAITSLCFSSDSTSVAAGYEDGSINIWQLSSSSSGYVRPLYTIKAIAKHDRLKKNVDGHLIGTPITYVSFIGSLRYQLVTSDSSGFIFYHHGFKKFMRKYFVTQKIIGNSNELEQKQVVLGCELLPLGNVPQITDEWGVLAVLTDHLLIVLSLLSLNDSSQLRVVNHFKTGIPKILHNCELITGCLSWFPCLKNDDLAKKFTTARLAYSWNNIITILELQDSNFSEDFMKQFNDRDKAIGSHPMKRTCRWRNSSGRSFRSLNWINPTLLSLFLAGEVEDDMKFETLSYIGGNRLLKVGNPDPMDLKISLNTTTNSWSGSIRVIKGRIMLLTESYHDSQKHLFVGMQLQWSHIIEIALAKGNYSKALNLIHKLFFSTDIMNIVSTDLPLELSSRQKILEGYVLRIISASTQLFLQKTEIEDRDVLEQNLSMVFDLISHLSFENFSLASQLLDIVEELFEKMEDNKECFFAVLEEYILASKISSLLPLVLKEMVRFYTLKGKGELLTEIICVLDIRSLDIDFTIQLCKMYGLRDCLIYIWNYVLRDYATPLMDFIRDIIEDVRILDEEDYMMNDEKQLHKVFTYISFILTGRQYPTDRYVKPDDEKFARKSIEDIIFAVSKIEEDYAKLIHSVKQTIFPYLFVLLKFNSFEMLSSLNEFFEDYTLNDQELNRQYIIEALLDIYEVNKSSFLDVDFCSLAIFIARNYSKYPQFIRLPDSTLDKVIDDLCNYDESWNNRIGVIDCELALQSLLQRYIPDNPTYLLVKLKEARFYSILMNIFKAEEKYSQVAAIWFEKKQRWLADRDSTALAEEEDTDYYDSMKVVLDMCLEYSSVSERIGVIDVIRRNFKLLLELDYDALLSVLNSYDPKLHSEILKISSEDTNTLVYQYLNKLFRVYDGQNGTLVIPELLQLGLKYVELLCVYSPDTVYTFVKEHLLFFGDHEKDLMHVLENGNAFESKTLILVNQKQYSEALNELIILAGRVLSDIPKYENVILLAMDICRSADGEPNENVEDENLNVNEKLWLQLVESLVRLSNQYGPEDKEHELLDMSIHNCFREISDDSSHMTQGVSFMRVFNRLLVESSTQNETTLSNVRSILRDVFLTYSFEKDSMGLMQTMLLEKIYKLLGIVKVKALQGYQITAKNCGVCGKELWGSKIAIEHQEAWEKLEVLRLDSATRVRLEGRSECATHPMVILGRGSPERIDGLEDITTKDYAFLKLIFFACGHGYHYQCLAKLNSVDSCLLPHK